MKIALVTVHSQPFCTLKDVAGGFGTAFHIGDSWRAKMLEHAKSKIASLPSTSLGYIAAQAHDAGHRVRVVDLSRTEKRYDAIPGDVDLAIVLTSIVDATAEREVMRDFARAKIPAFAYGSYASKKPDFFADSAQAVIVGEPENLGAHLFDPSLRGIVDAGFVKSLDDLLFPDWRAFPFASYRYAFLSFDTTLPLQGVRGCAFGCGYCPFRATSPFRERSPENIVSEARHLARTYGARAIAFRDPLFNLDRERVLAIARGLKPLKLRFSGEMRADRLDEEMLEKLHDAGLRSLEIGVESADLHMLTQEKRQPPSLEQIERVVKNAHRLGIRVIANFMFGLPDDTEEKIRATTALAHKLNTFAVQFTVATPYPGTTLETRVKNRLRVAKPENHTGWEPLFEHASLSPGKLRELREQAYVGYHFRPEYAGRFIRAAFDTLTR